MGIEQFIDSGEDGRPKMVSCDNCEKLVNRARVFFYFEELDGWIMSNPYLPDYYMSKVLCADCYTEKGYKKETWVEQQIRKGLLCLEKELGGD